MDITHFAIDALIAVCATGAAVIGFVKLRLEPRERELTGAQAELTKQKKRSGSKYRSSTQGSTRRREGGGLPPSRRNGTGKPGQAC